MKEGTILNSTVPEILAEDVHIHVYMETPTCAAVEVRCGEAVIYRGSGEADTSSVDAIQGACEDAARTFFLVGLLLMQSGYGAPGVEDYRAVLEDARDECIRLLVRR